jgi:hypothetical protein
MPLTSNIIQEMLLTSDFNTIASTAPRVGELSWPFNADVLRRYSSAGDPHVTVVDITTGQDRTVEVLAVLYDGMFLSRASELKLDGFNPNWRAAPPGIPDSFLHGGEVFTGYVRLYPPPSQNAPVTIITLAQPLFGTQRSWESMYFCLRHIEYLSSSDPMRARVGLSEFLKPLITLIEGNVHGNL